MIPPSSLKAGTLRPLTPPERATLRLFTAMNTDVVALSPTRTGMSKHLMDAIGPLRDLLNSKGFHDYARQPQGVVRRVMAKLITSQGTIKEIRASLYRPRTKAGDPRIWFERATEWCESGDMLGIFVLGGILHVTNLSTFSASGPAREELVMTLKEQSTSEEKRS